MKSYREVEQWAGLMNPALIVWVLLHGCDNPILCREPTVGAFVGTHIDTQTR